MSKVKPFWQSKTIWFNLVAVIVVIAGIFGYAEFEADPQLITLVTVLANIAFRFVTKQPIALE